MLKQTKRSVLSNKGDSLTPVPKERLSKGQVTRETILARAAGLFNSSGYSRSSMADIMKATGLEKGGIYHHFQSKEQLMYEAFEYAVSLYAVRLRQVVESESGSKDKLRAILRHFKTLLKDSPVPGGCPLMNTAIESDDVDEELKRRVRISMSKFRALIRNIIHNGISTGEFNTSRDPEQLAIFFIASLEGGLMLAKLYDNQTSLQAVGELLSAQIDTW